MTPDVFYGRMATIMAANPPYTADKPVVDQIARIGIIPGTPFNWNRLNATMQEAIARAIRTVLRKSMPRRRVPGQVLSLQTAGTHV